MAAPTLVTVFSRWPSLLAEVFPRWTKGEVDRCLSWALGRDWGTLRLDEVVYRLWQTGIVVGIDDDPRDTLVAIRKRYHDMRWIDAARRYREEDDPLVPWH